MRRRFISLVLLAVLLALPSMLHAYRLEKEWERSFEVEEGSLFELGNVNGSIEVEGWDRGTISVFAEIRVKAPSKSEAKKIFKKIEFDVESDDGHLMIKADIPRIRKTSFLNFFGDGNGSVRIDYTVKVPEGTSLDLESVNGDIFVEGVDGHFRFKTVNGKIEAVMLGGDGEISVVNGGIDCSLESFPEGGDLDVKNINGNVTIEIPEETGAEVDIKTLNGRIRLGFDLEKTVQLKKKRVVGEIGDGNGSIRIRTTNGGVRLTAI